MTSQIRTPSIRMGDIAVARHSGVLRTLLGSCLGVALYDRRLKLGALAHIVLPKAQGPVATPGKFADTAVPAMLEQMRELADSSALRVHAKLAGGANMFATPNANTIGAQNVTAIECVLAELRIPIVARHCGGEQGRRMTLDASTGLVTIDIVGVPTITL